MEFPKSSDDSIIIEIESNGSVEKRVGTESARFGENLET